MPEMNLVERYQAHRTRRFLANSEKWRHMLPGWRTQRRRRILVIALSATFTFMFVVGVLCHFFERAPLLWLPASLLFFPIWISLQIASGRQGDAPVATLDEWEVQQQSAARSTGLTITQWLVLIPVVYLTYGSAITGGEHPTMAYAGGLLTLTALMIGGCSPAMILAWSRPDPDPESDEFPMEAA
ncbi:hypothetical protein [Rhodococcus sp. NPDC058514]|uniref:hypothetical protein n=1 Tax=unclassified Rhodococcus (in: high G+C Gram-positive bacteria) TaxID=192944 RepID=UPI0036680B4B